MTTFPASKCLVFFKMLQNTPIDCPYENKNKETKKTPKLILFFFPLFGLHCPFQIFRYECYSLYLKPSQLELKMWTLDGRVLGWAKGLSLCACRTETLSALTAKVTLSCQVLKPPSLIFPGKEDLGRLW